MLAPRRQQLTRDRTDIAVAHGSPINLGHGQYAVRSRGEEGLIRVVEVVGLKLLFSDRDSQTIRKVKDGLAGHTLKDALVAGRL